MATRLDTSLRPKALALITKFGVSATITIPGGTYDPTTGTKTGSPAAVTVSTVATPVSETSSSNFSLWNVGNGHSYLRGDVSTAPRIGATLTVNGAVWEIEEVVTMRTGDLVAAYHVRLKR